MMNKRSVYIMYFYCFRENGYLRMYNQLYHRQINYNSYELYLIFNV